MIERTRINGKLVGIILLSSAAGALVGAYATFEFLKWFYLDGVYSAEVSKASVEVGSLGYLRAGEIEPAIKALELSVYGSELFLEASKKDASEAVKPTLERVLSMIKQYKEEYGLAGERE